MQIICSWCKKLIGEKEPLEDKIISHTICLECEKLHFPIKEGKHVQAEKKEPDKDAPKGVDTP